MAWMLLKHMNRKARALRECPTGIPEVKMAHRDRSQGFGFVYVDISTLLKQRDAMNAPSVNFNKDPEKPKATEESTQEREETPDRISAIHQIKQNLDRLQTLHHKLHVMLEELNQITSSKRRR